MARYGTPGVYYERADAGLPGISAIRTDVAGFVGIARRGPLDTPVAVESWRQFLAHFGDFTGAGYLAYAVRAFFENGGRRCWVVRVAAPQETPGGAAVAGVTLQNTATPARDVWRVEASSPGVWGNDLSVALRETHRAQTGSRPGGDATFTPVASITGFARGTLARVSQGASVARRVVSDIDPVGKRLIWLHPRPEARLSYDAPLPPGFDAKGALVIESVEYTLLVRERGRLVRVYEDLSPIPEHPRYGPGAMPAGPEPIAIRELRALPPAALDPLALPGDGAALPLSGGADGLAALQPYDFVGEEIDPLESDVSQRRKRRGLRALERVDEVGILAVPDIHIRPFAPPATAPPPAPCVPDPCLPPPPPAPAPPPPPAFGDLPPVFGEEAIFQVQAAMIAQCEKRRDRIALLDAPWAAARDDPGGVGAVRAWRSRFDTAYAALYYPWLRVVDPLRGQGFGDITRDVPPGGHVAGQYAGTDWSVGVHKAPANAPLIWTQDVTVAVNEAAHEILNPEGINAIRPLAGRGIRIYGARTLSSDPDWRFVNVRRLLLMIEKAIGVSIQWAVFEPNSPITRAKLQLVLTSYLLALWQRGALTGAVAGEAFFVRCDETNNPASEREGGRLLAQVGVAPSQPFEFVVLRVGRADNEFEITEETAAFSTPGGSLF